MDKFDINSLGIVLALVGAVLAHFSAASVPPSA